MEGYVVVARFFSHLLERPFLKDILGLLPGQSGIGTMVFVFAYINS
jgi:hypothetical protein